MHCVCIAISGKTSLKLHRHSTHPCTNFIGYYYHYIIISSNAFACIWIDSHISYTQMRVKHTPYYSHWIWLYIVVPCYTVT